MIDHNQILLASNCWGTGWQAYTLPKFRQRDQLSSYFKALSYEEVFQIIEETNASELERVLGGFVLRFIDSRALCKGFGSG